MKAFLKATAWSFTVYQLTPGKYSWIENGIEKCLTRFRLDFGPVQA